MALDLELDETTATERAMASVASKISESAFKVSVGILLGLGILLATARIVIRFQKLKIGVDDGFLLLATVTLAAGTVLVFINVPGFYANDTVDVGVLPSTEGLGLGQIHAQIYAQKLQYAAAFLLWTSIFSVKFSFLFFFRQLIRRIRAMIICWWVVFWVLIPAWIVCACAHFASCPVIEFDASYTCITPAALIRENYTLGATSILDIVTDVMLIFIPAILLWRVHTPLYKRLALAGVLCLSVFMIGISIIKLTTADLSNGEVDTPWNIFWLQAEACFAVIMVSISAFRSLFITDGTKKSQEPNSNSLNKNSARLCWEQEMAKFKMNRVPPEVYNSTKVEARGFTVMSVEPTPTGGIRVTHEIDSTYFDTKTNSYCTSDGSCV